MAATPARRTRATSSSCSTAERARSTCPRGVVQYAATTGDESGSATNLAGQIPPGGYLLVQEATGNSRRAVRGGAASAGRDRDHPDGGGRGQGGPRHQPDDDPAGTGCPLGRDPGLRRLRDRHELLRGRRPDREPVQHDRGHPRRRRVHRYRFVKRGLLRGGAVAAQLRQSAHACASELTLSINDVSMARGQRGHDDVRLHREPVGAGGRRAASRSTSPPPTAPPRRRDSDYASQSLTGQSIVEGESDLPVRRSRSTATPRSRPTRRSS